MRRAPPEAGGHPIFRQHQSRVVPPGAYKSTLTDSCGMEELRQVYQDAYDRYKKTAQE